MQVNVQDIASDTPPIRYSAASNWGVVAMLGLALTLSFMDRSFINLVLEPVRVSLDLSDTQMGLLIGPAFIIFYSIVALPLGRMADSLNRKLIVSGGLFFWSIATGMSGLACNFGMMFGARMGIGAGEAALMPAAISILGDRFERHQLGRAVAVFTALGSLGGGLSYLLGGLLLGWLEEQPLLVLPYFGELEPWRTAFLCLAFPGILLAIIMVLVMREPVRRIRKDKAEVPGWRRTIAYFKQYPKATILLILGYSAISVGANGAWIPTFMYREYGWAISELGPILGAISLCVNLTGVLTGGWLADYLRKSGREDANVVVAIGALLLALPCDLLLPNVGNPYLSLVFYALAAFFVMICFGVSTASLPLVVPSHMRSQTVAIYVLVANLVGQGIGPVVVPLLTDQVFGDPSALRYSLTIVPGIFIPLAILCLILARRPFAERAEALKEEMTAAHLG